jgi:hypothetical protein
MTPINTLRYEAATLRRSRAARRLAAMPKPAGRTRDRYLADLLLLEETLSHPTLADTARTEAADPPFATVGTPDLGALLAVLLEHFGKLHRRLDTLDRHAADLMFLQLSAQDMLFGQRRDFSERSQALIIRVVAGEPYKGRCPCCMDVPVLAREARPVPGAEFDHFFHRSLNRPEYGWLVCTACHHELTHDGYLARFRRMAAFRSFQAAVITQRRRAQMRPGAVGP